MMEIRTFKAGDAKTLLNLWNLAHPQYPLTEALLLLFPLIVS